MRHRRRPRQRLQHRDPAALDTPGDFHLSVPRQQRHRAHLAQIHADRIAGLVDRAGSEVEFRLVTAFRPALQTLLLLVLVLRLDDLDTGVAERVEQLVQLFGRGNLRRKQVVDLVEEEIASFLADDDQLLDLVVTLFDRQLPAWHPVTSSGRLAVADQRATERLRPSEDAPRWRLYMAARHRARRRVFESGTRLRRDRHGHFSASIRGSSWLLRASRDEISLCALGEPSSCCR